MSAVFPPVRTSSAPTSFLYTVVLPAASVTVAHDLNTETLTVTAYDPSGEEVEVGVTVIDAGTVEITTVPELPFSGTVAIVAGTPRSS